MYDLHAAKQTKYTNIQFKEEAKCQVNKNNDYLWCEALAYSSQEEVSGPCYIAAMAAKKDVPVHLKSCQTWPGSLLLLSKRLDTYKLSKVSVRNLKARLHWRFYLDENVGVLATVSMFVVMDVYDSQGKQIHAPWDVTF